MQKICLKFFLILIKINLIIPKEMFGIFISIRSIHRKIRSKPHNSPAGF